MSERICIFDVETTGTNAESDQIIELCVQFGLSDSSEVSTWRFKPGVPISPGAQAVHGISMNDLKDCPPFAEHANEIREMIEGADILVGYNLAFDLGFLQAEFRRIEQDALNISDALLVDPYQLWRQCEPRNLSAAYKRFAGKEMQDAHAASADVAATGEILEGMVKDFGLSDKSWNEIAQMCPIHSGRKNQIGPSNHFIWQGEVAVFGFGKHRSRPIIEVAKEDKGSYAQWVASKDFPGHVKKIIKAAMDQSPEEFSEWLSKNF